MQTLESLFGGGFALAFIASIIFTVVNIKRGGKGTFIALFAISGGLVLIAVVLSLVKNNWQCMYLSFIPLVFSIINLIAYIKYYIYYGRDDNQEEETDYNYYEKNYESLNEERFHEKLEKIAGSNYRVISQIPLLSFCEREGGTNNQQGMGKTIDFGFMNKTSRRIMVLIELNDATHDREDRKERDAYVNEICKKVGIPLVTFYYKEPINDLNYIKEKIEKYL